MQKSAKTLALFVAVAICLPLAFLPVVGLSVSQQEMQSLYVQRALVTLGYLEDDGGTEFSGFEIEDAIMWFQEEYGLPVTGIVDDDTLTWLFEAEEEFLEEHGAVWIPTKGGKKYHSSSGCSSMIDPRYVSTPEAEELGFTPCKKCY